MTTHAMIDIETLGIEPDTIVLSVGAVKFDAYTQQEPYDRKIWRPSVDEQVAVGRTTSDDTLAWWSKQPEDIQDLAFTEQGRLPVLEMMTEINRYLVGVDKIWCQGPQFDMLILENMYKQFAHHTNWMYWQIQDCRTIFNMMPVDPRKAIQMNAHSADDDAYWQAVCVQKTFKHFSVTRR